MIKIQFGNFKFINVIFKTHSSLIDRIWLGNFIGYSLGNWFMKHIKISQIKSNRNDTSYMEEEKRMSNEGKKESNDQFK
jgi:hypothetical protein